MSKQTTVTVTCDYCRKLILDNENYIDASNYGKDFHIACVTENMTAEEILIALELDNIRYGKGTQDKFIYYHADGSHR